jgi:hypothetical protein
MIQEHVFTSAPAGLTPGSFGFCTVAATRGMPPHVISQLESLCGYRPLHRPDDPRAALNPTAHAHWRVRVAGQTVSVLSRVAYVGADYSGRGGNKLAHGLLLAEGDQVEAGPAWLLRQPGLLREQWSGAPQWLPPCAALPTGDNSPRACQTWSRVAGDAGWAGRLVEAFLLDPARPTTLVLNDPTPGLELFDEAMALLPVATRWRVSFCTYFTDLPAGASCAWRICVAGTPAAAQAAGSGGLVIDLTRPLPALQASRHVASARSGQPAAVTPAPSLVRRTVAQPDVPQPDVIALGPALRELEADPWSSQVHARRGPAPATQRIAPWFWLVALTWPFLAWGMMTALSGGGGGSRPAAERVKLQREADRWKAQAEHERQRAEAAEAQLRQLLSAPAPAPAPTQAPKPVPEPLPTAIERRIDPPPSP